MREGIRMNSSHHRSAHTLTSLPDELKPKKDLISSKKARYDFYNKKDKHRSTRKPTLECHRGCVRIHEDIRMNSSHHRSAHTLTRLPGELKQKKKDLFSPKIAPHDVLQKNF